MQVQVQFGDGEEMILEVTVEASSVEQAFTVAHRDNHMSVSVDSFIIWDDKEYQCIKGVISECAW